MWTFEISNCVLWYIGVKKSYCNYALTVNWITLWLLQLTGNYERIVIIIMQQLLVHSNFYLHSNAMVIMIITTNWGEPERAPHSLKSVMVSYVACMDCENDKIVDKPFKFCHGFVRRVYGLHVRKIKYDGQAIQFFIRHVCILWVLRGRWSEGRET